MEKDAAALGELGYQVVAISQDPPETNAKTAKKNKVSFTMLADKDMEAAGKFGVAFSMDDKTVKAYKGYGIDLVALYGRSEPQMTVPAVFLLNEKGVVTFQYVNPNYAMRLPSEVLLSAAKAL